MALSIKIDELLKGKTVEWEHLDFKRRWNPKDVIHSACAFANDIHNWGGGYIIIGVDEKNGVPVLPPVGIDLYSIDSIQKELVNLCNQVQPTVNVLAEPVEFMDKMIPSSMCQEEKCVHIKHRNILARKYRRLVKCIMSARVR